MRIAITTLGCKINQYDSAVIQSRLEDKHSFVAFDEVGGLLYDQYLHGHGPRGLGSAPAGAPRQPAKSSWLRCLVTGCYAQVNPDEVARVPGVDFVVGLNRLDDLLRFVEAVRPRKRATDRRERHEAGARRSGARHARAARAHAGISENSGRLQLFLHLLHYSRQRAGSAAASRRAK